MNRQEYTHQRWTPTVEIDVGLAYEFIMTLTRFPDHKDECTTDEYEVENTWFDTVRAKVSPELLRGIEQFSLCAQGAKGYVHGWESLLGLAYDCPPPKDVPALIAHLEMLDPLEVRLHMLGYYQRKLRRITPLDVVLQAAEGDPKSQRQYLSTAFPDDRVWQKKIRALFALDLEAAKTTMVDLLRGWYEQVFYDLEQQVRPILESDAQAKRALQQSMTFDRLFETATNGLEYAPEPGVRRIVLVPCFIGRPWNHDLDYQDMKIFCYPVADEYVVQDRTAPPAQLVRLYRALADERRLRILKLLKTKSYSLSEIATEFGVAKSTMHHHLGMMRTAGLVRVRSDENLYSLREDRLSKVSELLDAYLNGPS